MSAFDKVIGYEEIKRELQMVCDMLRNREAYEKLGAKIPRGILLSGDPGLGKTTLAKAFIKESGWEHSTIVRSRNEPDMCSAIRAAFGRAMGNQPAIVLLDDMDKFASDNDFRRDPEEFQVIQECIDKAADFDVLVIATVNNTGLLPASLIREGRFDVKLELTCPNRRDAAKIIRHYLSDKAVDPDLNYDDLTAMFSYRSCAELESLLNSAAIRAAYEGRGQVEMEDLVRVVMKQEHDVGEEEIDRSSKNARSTAMHEAGHAVIMDLLHPGRPGLAAIFPVDEDEYGGFVQGCGMPHGHGEKALITLGGKAAVELYYPDWADGCGSDLRKAMDSLRREVVGRGSLGFSLMDTMDEETGYGSPTTCARMETAIQTEMERLYREARGMLIRNRAYLEAVCEALLEKGTLLRSDMKKLREACEVRGLAG